MSVAPGKTRVIGRVVSQTVGEPLLGSRNKAPVNNWKRLSIIEKKLVTDIYWHKCIKLLQDWALGLNSSFYIYLSDLQVTALAMQHKL